jgi:cell division protein FtsL
MSRRVPLLLLLVAVNLVSALAVIQAKHRARELQHELQVLRVERDRFKTEWAQLQLEESAWANPDRIARIARERLDMHQPRQYAVLEDTP